MDFRELGVRTALEKLGYATPAMKQRAQQDYAKWHAQHGQGRAWDPKAIESNAQTHQLIDELDSVYNRYRQNTGRDVRFSRQIDFGKPGSFKAAMIRPGMASPWSLMFGNQKTPPNPALQQQQQNFQRMSMGTGLTNPAHPLNNQGPLAKTSGVAVPTPHEQTYGLIKLSASLAEFQELKNRTDPRARDARHFWTKHLSPGGQYHSMSPRMARYIHGLDTKKQRATVPQIAGVFGLPVPKAFQQFKSAGVAVPTPYEQTYQRQATNLSPTGATEEINSTWDLHDQRVDQNTQPPFDSDLITDGQLST